MVEAERSLSQGRGSTAEIGVLEWKLMRSLLYIGNGNTETKPSEMETASATFYSCALLFLFLTFTLSSLLRNSKKPGLPPGGPLALPIIGHLHLLRRPLHHTLAAISARYGPLLLLRFGVRPVLLLSAPSAVEECLTKNDITFANRPVRVSGHYFGRRQSDISSAPYGPHWRNQRKIASLHVLSAARVTSLTSFRSSEVVSLLRYLFTSGGDGHGYTVVNMTDRLSELTFNTLVGMMGGKEAMGAEEGRRFREVVEEAFVILSGASSWEDFFPILRWVGMKWNVSRMEALSAELEVMLQGLVEKRRQLPVQGEKKSLIDVMLSLQEVEPDYYTDDFIKGIIQALILAGTDTSFTAMEWALSLLLNNPEKLRKVREEIENQVGHKHLLTDSDLSNLPYLHNVIKEALRLYPPGPLLVPHYSSKECIVGGYRIPCGTMLLINAYSIHRDPNLWEEPDKFRPERFEGGEGEGYHYIPFGSGRRRCPGEGLAMRLTALALGSLIQCFEWKRIGDEELDMTEGEGLSMPRAVPLEAMYKPCGNMFHILSQL